MLRFLAFRFYRCVRKEGIVKYFLAQRLGSLLFLVFLFGETGTTQVKIGRAIFLLPLLLKLGFPPFHWWLVRFFQDRNWLGMLAIRSIQKVLPIYALAKIFPRRLTLVIILGGRVALLGMLTQVLIKKVLAYSSILRVG